MGHKLQSMKPGKMGNRKKGVLTRKERLDLMVKTYCDERTIRRWERGERVQPATAARLIRAAKDLGIPVPGAVA